MARRRRTASLSAENPFNCRTDFFQGVGFLYVRSRPEALGLPDTVRFRETACNDGLLFRALLKDFLIGVQAVDT